MSSSLTWSRSFLHLDNKHGAFGGPGMDEDNLYAAGSDDFRGYLWKIPPTTQLMEQRQKFSAEEWPTSNSGRIGKIENKICIN